jgi:uncharacterized protein (DUF983 family)
MIEASARVAAALEMSDLAAMCSISSVLFTVLFLLLIWLSAMLIWSVYLDLFLWEIRQLAYRLTQH